MSDAELKNEFDKLKKEFSKVPAEKLKGVMIGRLRGKADIQKILKLLNQ